MPSDMQVKICGLNDQAAIDVSVQSGARYLGFNFFSKSPRYVSPEQAASLAATVPPGVCKVALAVDPGDDLLETLLESVPIDMLQLHGSEPVDRVAEVRERYGLPVMKAVGISDEDDVAKLQEYGRVADQLLVDAKPPRKSELPGGNGLTFDWRLIAGRRWSVPWMLAGGLTAQNVAEAVHLTGARQLDVSSGVESAPGMKDAEKIKAFLSASGVSRN